MHQIKEKFEDRSFQDCLNSMWLLTLRMESFGLRGFCGFVVMLQYLQIRVLSASTKTKLLCETEIDRALNTKLDVFTLLLLHRLSLQKEMQTCTYTPSRICKTINLRLLEMEPEEDAKVMDMVTSSYSDITTRFLYGLRSTAHQLKSLVSIRAVEQILQDRFNRSQPLGKLNCINQYLAHLHSLTGDNKLWPDVSELRTHGITSVLRCIAGEVYLATSCQQGDTQPGHSQQGHSNRRRILSQLTQSLTSAEKTRLVEQLQVCGLVDPGASFRPNVSGAFGEVSSSEDRPAVRVETSDFAVQENLYESTWIPRPEYDYRLLGPIERLRHNNNLIVAKVAKLEDVSKDNDKDINENNMHITSLENSLRRREALKIELESRDQRVKHFRSTILAQRATYEGNR